MLTLLVLSAILPGHSGPIAFDGIPDSKIYDIRRSFVAGERDVFALDATVEMALGQILHVRGELTQLVRKVTKLDAEITQLTSSKMTSDSYSNTIEESNRISQVVFSKYGVVVTGEKVSGNEYPFGELLQYALLTPLSGIKDKHWVTFDSRTPENPRNFCRGKISLESIVGADASMRSHVEFLNDETPTEVKVDTLVTWNWQLGKPNRIVLDMTHLPHRNGKPDIANIHLVAIRKDSK